MAAPDLLKGIAKSFLEPLSIGTTLEMLDERFRRAVEQKNHELVLSIAGLIEKVKRVQSKQIVAPEVKSQKK